jgi:hypothetical protein
MPTGIPSSLITFLAVAIASSLETFSIESINLVFKFFGIKPAPIP